MNAVTPKSDPVEAARLLLKELQNQFPVFRDGLPLAIGIDKQILAQMPGTDRKALRIALGMHTKSTRYLKQTELSTSRANLDGSAAGEITDVHRTRAKEILRERRQKIAEQRKAQRVAEEAERKRTEKLSQLVEKFGRQKS